jgi:hypothetical protein
MPSGRISRYKDGRERRGLGPMLATVRHRGGWPKLDTRQSAVMSRAAEAYRHREAAEQGVRELSKVANEIVIKRSEVY